jgi:hypothetical protein
LLRSCTKLLKKGHDVVAMASPERFVVGLDISESALAKANEVNWLIISLSYVFVFRY